MSPEGNTEVLAQKVLSCLRGRISAFFGGIDLFLEFSLFSVMARHGECINDFWPFLFTAMSCLSDPNPSGANYERAFYVANPTSFIKPDENSPE